MIERIKWARILETQKQILFVGMEQTRNVFKEFGSSEEK